MAGAAYTQYHFRIRNDDGSETTATWRQALDTSDTRPVTTNFRVRFEVGADGTISGTTQNLYYSKNGGAYTAVSGSTPIQFALSSNFADGDDTTQQIGSGTFTTNNNGMKETTGGESIGSAANAHWEAEWNLTLDNAQVSIGDTFDLRMRNGSTAYANYNQTPRITVNIVAIDLNVTGGDNGDGIGGVPGFKAFGQCFTGNGYTLEYANFTVKQSSSPDGSVSAKIYAITGTYGTNGKPTGSALATSDSVNCSSLSGSFATQQFTFSGASRITLTNATKYVVSIEMNGDNTTGAVYLYDSYANPHGGNYAYHDYGSWTGGSAGDLVFGVYGSAAVSGPANLKTVNGLVKASVKTVDGLAIASVKTWDGLA